MTKMTTSMPSSSCEIPNENRASPVSWSMPTNPSARPRKRLTSPRAIDEPSSTETVVNATTASAKYSAGPKRSANDASGGAKNASASVASVPATNDPMAAVVSAAAPRPWRAIMCPSMAVTIDAVSPGVFSRMLVVDPPYIAP